MPTKKKMRTKKSEPVATTKRREDLSSSSRTARTIKSFSQAQLAALIFLSVGISYIIEYNKAVSGGTTSKACSLYLVNTEACTEDDVIMLRLKYYGSVVCLVLVAATSLLCWNDEPLLLRLNSFLCLSPLTTTLLALYVSRQDIVARQILRLAVTCSAILVLVLSSVLVAPQVARPLWDHTGSFQSIVILTLMLALWRDVVVLLREGSGSYIRLQQTDPTSTAAELLSHFVALDKFTMSLLFAFALVFFNDRRKRTFLFFVAVARLTERYSQFHQLQEDLRDADTVGTFLVGSAILAGAAWLAPTLTWKNQKRD